MLSSLIQLDDFLISQKIYESRILNNLMYDYSKFENNTNVLILLNGTVKSILTSKTGQFLLEKILFDLKLIEFFAQRLQSKDYLQSISIRTNIYPFIHNMTAFLIDLISQQ